MKKYADSIWKRFNAGELTAKQAFTEMRFLMERGATEQDIKEFKKLAEKILDKDIPLEERDHDVEKAFQASTRRESED